MLALLLMPALLLMTPLTLIQAWWCKGHTSSPVCSILAHRRTVFAALLLARSLPPPTPHFHYCWPFTVRPNIYKQV